MRCNISDQRAIINFNEHFDTLCIVNNKNVVLTLNRVEKLCFYVGRCQRRPKVVIRDEEL